jgi:hypothetical protein
MKADRKARVNSTIGAIEKNLGLSLAKAITFVLYIIKTTTTGSTLFGKNSLIFVQYSVENQS